MNYHRIHSEIINRAVCRKPDNGCFESHHIVPRCLGGTNDPSNLVQLTPHEHRLIHALLVKMHPKNRKLAWAANLMYSASCKHSVRVSGQHPNWLRKQVAIGMQSVWADPNQAEKMKQSMKNAWVGATARRETVATRQRDWMASQENINRQREAMKLYWQSGGHVSHTPVFTDELCADIHARYLAGETQVKLASEYGVSRRCVANAINRATGSGIKPKSLTSVEIATAVKLRIHDGLSWSQLSKIMGKSLSTIRTHVLQNSNMVLDEHSVNV